MPKPAKRPATYDDLLKVPDNLVAEIVEGELFTSPRPASPHARAASSLGARILSNFDDGGGNGPGGWWILHEPELHLGPDVLVPDIAGWRRERMPLLENTAAFELAPDWVCEVISPSTGRLDRMFKLPAYARSEVAYAWIVDPIQRFVEAFRLVNGRWVLLGTYGAEVARIEPFDAIEIPLGTLWMPEASAS
ncbi:MAG TPA: Uma2 family endonuclease [Thermoanaerobaculia bacterium]|nr:Uma2 family endonuclease [Thermoanaerobaculia bacterium]